MENAQALSSYRLGCFPSVWMASQDSVLFISEVRNDGDSGSLSQGSGTYSDSDCSQAACLALSSLFLFLITVLLLSRFPLIRAWLNK
jgi:hypothetical protein